MAKLPAISDFEMLEKIGCGSYSVVHRARKKHSTELYAIKIVEKKSLSKTSTTDNLITEIQLLKTLKHKHIVDMKEFMWDEKNIYIVMEYCNAGNLSTYIKRHTTLPESSCKFFIRQLAQAMHYMRSNNVCHFDLKPHNLLLSRNTNFKLKVADFGFAQHLTLGQENHTIKGSPLYMAPEILLNHCYDASADLWSIGVILYECLFGKAPYSSKSLDELFYKIKIKQPIKLPRSAKISSCGEDFLMRLLQHDPKKRISFQEFFDHDFVAFKEAPTCDNLNKAVSLVTSAVEEDQKENYKKAFHLYCEGLKYFVPLIQTEEDSTKKQQLQERALSYMKRAEEIKSPERYSQRQTSPQHTHSKVSGTFQPQTVQAALKPSQTFEQLLSMSGSSPKLKSGLEIGRQAELYLYENKLNICLEKLTAALGVLVPLLQDEPKGARRELLHLQIMEWMKEAESIKSLRSAIEMQQADSTSSSYNCCIQ